MESVEIREQDDAYVLGAEIDGVFVPFVSQPAAYVAALVQAGKANPDEPAPAAEHEQG